MIGPLLFTKFRSFTLGMMAVSLDKSLINQWQTFDPAYINHKAVEDLPIKDYRI
jgi:hypothetical protein